MASGDREDRVGTVIFVKRLEHNDFVAGIDDGLMVDIIASVDPQHTVKFASGSTATPYLFEKSFAMASRSGLRPTSRRTGDIGVDRSQAAAFHRRRRRKIRKPCERLTALVVREARHLADEPIR